MVHTTAHIIRAVIHIMQAARIHIPTVHHHHILNAVRAIRADLPAEAAVAKKLTSPLETVMHQQGVKLQ